MIVDEVGTMPSSLLSLLEKEASVTNDVVFGDNHQLPPVNGVFPSLSSGLVEEVPVGD